MNLNWSFWKILGSNLPNLILIGVVGFVGLAGFTKFKNWIDIQNVLSKSEMLRQEAVQRQYLQLALNIARSETKMVTKNEMKDLVKELVAPQIQELIKKNDETVIGVGQVMSRLQQTAVKDAKPDKETSFRHIVRDTEGNPILDPSGNLQYTDAKGLFINIRTNEGSDNPGPNLAWVYIQNYSGEAWPEQMVIRKGTYKINMEVLTTLTQQKSGTGYNNFTKINFKATKRKDDWYGKDYPVEITSARHYFLKPKQKFFYIAPHIDVGMLPVYNLSTEKANLFPELGGSLFGIGRTRNDLDWKFVRGAFTYNKEAKFGLSFYPVGYNIGRWIWLTSDLWFSPGFGFLPDSKASFLSLSLSTTL